MRHFSLFEFEDYVPARILQRGHQYYRERRIREMDEMDPGEWYADAHGTAEEPYEVFIRLHREDPTIVEDYYCSCPYDLGMCKHVVAFLYELRELAETQRAEEEEEAALATVSPSLSPSVEGQKQGREEAEAVAVASPSLEIDLGEWVARYELLEAPTRMVWEVLAMFWSPISQRRLARIVAALPAHRELPRMQLKEELELLQRLGLVETNGMGSYWVAEEPGHWLPEQLFDTHGGFRQAIEAIRQAVPEHKGRQKLVHDEEALFRELRFARYLNDARAFLQVAHYLNVEAPNKYSKLQIVHFWLGEESPPNQLMRFPKGIRSALTLLQLELMLEGALPVRHELIDWLLPLLARTDVFLPSFVKRITTPLLYLLLFTTRFDELLQLAQALPEGQGAAYRLLVRIWTEGLEAAAPDLHKLCGSPFERMRRHKPELPYLARCMAVVAALRSGVPGTFAELEEKVEEHLLPSKRNSAFPHPDTSLLLALAWALLQDEPETLQRLYTHKPYEGVDALFLQLFRQWCGLPVDEQKVEALRTHFAHLQLKLWEAEAEQLLAQHRGASENGAFVAAPAASDTAPALMTLAAQLRPRKAWELVLERLEQIVAGPARAVPAVQERIAWFFEPEQRVLIPRHQKISVRTNSWTQGRRLSLSDLTTRYAELLTADDWQLVRAVRSPRLQGEILLDAVPHVLRLLPGHPHIYLAAQPDVPVRFELVQATLVLVHTPEGFRFQLSPHVPGPGLHLVPLTRTRYSVVEVPEMLSPVLELVSRTEVVVPPQAEARLEEVVRRLRPKVPILTEKDLEALPKVEADARIYLHLIPVGSAFEIEMLVKPLRHAPPFAVPGRGDVLVLGMVEGQRVRTYRDLEAERRRRAQLEALPAWQALEKLEHGWRAPDSLTCLGLLQALQPLVQAGEIVVEWPEGGEIGISRQLDVDDFRLRITSTDYWFALEGEVQVDDDRLVSLMELFEMMDRHGRFVPLGPSEFVALTDRLAKQLAKLKRLAEKKKDDLCVSKLGALALDELLSELAHVETDAFFRQTLERARAAFARTYELPPPELFTATLRPYQREGYVWLRRLADWGVGACLADDMGLGKTIQALALMSVRAAAGPQLVVAPASVCRNWVVETRKFAPALRPLLFGEADREEMIRKVEAGDLVIVTYDLMAREAERFASRQWATVVLDEAQAIKNHQTNRSRAAMMLQSDFKLIMTGTPVENHLGELWNLFHFINPGLLGSRAHFRLRFALPIENGETSAREALQRLLRPFILRRRKDEVLKDLPEKTEIVLEVPLSEEEQTFYEALRRKALDKLQHTHANDGQVRIQILAELMRLRLAACHPRLVDPAAPIAHSAKLQLFSQLVEELVDGGHKALVFSQFVKHLKLLEEVLAEKGIAYQYLDGQTPTRVRQQRIEAFQRGQGDVFLISLKAGGTGLNLTAADYVIHMDPWWNPAVEDQATDRAHRIGQERPVTVYRLVAAHTIEEKILRLHQEKRDLADALLAGTDASARLSLEALMELLQD